MSHDTRSFTATALMTVGAITVAYIAVPIATRALIELDALKTKMKFWK